jgi:transcriptional regulator with XRE-family HTH domain
MTNYQELAIDVGVSILAARVKKGLTQAKLAALIGSNQPVIARIERGNALPSLDFLMRIAEALGTFIIAPRFGFMERGTIFYTLKSSSATQTIRL